MMRVRLTAALLVLSCLAVPVAYGQEEGLQLDVQRGPGVGDVAGKATIEIPEGYVFLDPKETDKYLVATQNLPAGNSYFFGPESGEFESYLTFLAEGFIKDNEELDAIQLLRTLQQQQIQANKERDRRGWPAIHLIGWHIPPRYNDATRVLEWSTKIQDENSGQVSINHFTRVLGRRGYTSVQTVVVPDGADERIALAQRNLAGFKYVENERYADFKPGDRVAEYGLAALITGGAAAVASKKGFFSAIAAFLATAWKFVLAGVIAAGLWVKRVFSRKNKDR
jgi:uncharacterized membrane-anchored protein